jgi:hypothetical protein
MLMLGSSLFSIRYLWAVSAGGELGNDEVTGIALDDNGNIIITGHFFLSAYFGNITLTSLGYYDIFVAKLDTNGKWLWAVRAGAYVGESCFGIAIDSEGNEGTPTKTIGVTPNPRTKPSSGY